MKNTIGRHNGIVVGLIAMLSQGIKTGKLGKTQVVVEVEVVVVLDKKTY